MTTEDEAWLFAQRPAFARAVAVAALGVKINGAFVAVTAALP